MLEAYSSKRKNNPWRAITKEETDLINALLKGHPCHKKFRDAIRSGVVRTMLDGDMGSIEFFCENFSPMGGILAEAEYIDIDEILVIITAIKNKSGDLYEIDFWKVDFSPLKKYPNPKDLRSIRICKNKS